MNWKTVNSKGLFDRRSFLSTIAVLLLFASSEGMMSYTINGQTSSILIVQLWYDGYWQESGWVNGTMVPFTSPQVRGNIAIVFGPESSAPYEPILKKVISKGATAVVLLRSITGGVPGLRMYYIDGSNQLPINVPVFEVQTTATNLTTLPDSGIPVNIYPEENKWKTANDKIAYQITWNVILSLFQIVIIGMALHRLRQFWIYTGFNLLTISQLCISLELVACVARLMNTILDPFFSFRILNVAASSTLATVFLPFEMSSGILLTFYWAEALTVHRVSATPFISDFKKTAIVVISILFIGEIVCDVVRVCLNNANGFDPTYITFAFYVIAALTLTICYLLCAVNIVRKLSLTKASHIQIRNMTIRFSLSTAGYVVFIGCIAALIVIEEIPWGWKIDVNVMFLATSFSSALQVWSFKPELLRKSRTRTNSQLTVESSKDFSSGRIGYS